MIRVQPVLILSAFMGLAACQSDTAAQTDPVEGAWEMQSVTWISDERTSSIEKTQPGRILFVDGQYSLMWTPTKEPRKPFQVLADPTDAETIAAFKSMIYNAGAYTLGDGTLETKATIARVPGFEGGKQFFSYAVDGEKLTLRMVDEIYPNGEKPEWSGTWETEFVFERAGS